MIYVRNSILICSLQISQFLRTNSCLLFLDPWPSLCIFCLLESAFQPVIHIHTDRACSRLVHLFKQSVSKFLSIVFTVANSSLFNVQMENAETQVEILGFF